MSSHNNPAKRGMNGENQSSGTRKTTTSTNPPEPVVKCPRCDSPNTKFCYYNNYSLTQPRHFCKTCRRYWTKGGSLRNIPVGGGCQKIKKVKSSRFSAAINLKEYSSLSENGGLKIFHGISPAIDFQLGGISLPRINYPLSTGTFYNQNQLSSLGDHISAVTLSSSSASFSLDQSGGSHSLTGFKYPTQNIMSSMNVHSNLSSSIESLSSINQDLHWKLQQQRLNNVFFGGDSAQKDTGVISSHVNPLGQNQTQKLQPILFQNLEISKPDNEVSAIERKDGTSGGDTATEWFFGNSHAGQVTSTPRNSVGTANDNGKSRWNIEVQSWNDLNSCSTGMP